MKEWIYKLLGSLMTDEEKEKQRRSFAYGNAKLHNSDITREIVNDVAERTGVKSGQIAAKRER